MGAVASSTAQIVYLRDLRLVCWDFLRAVPVCIGNEEWMRPLTHDAADFRAGVALTGIARPPFSLNRGIEQLLRAGNWRSLGTGMREHIFDSTTQEYLIKRFRKYLAPPMSEAKIRRRKKASKFVSMQTVAWAMRLHSTNRQIQLDGIHLMSYMAHDLDLSDTIAVSDGGRPTSKLSAYIIATVAVLMRDPNDLAVLDTQRACLQTLRNVVDVIDGSWRTFNYYPGVVIDYFALIQIDTHNMLALLIRVINTHHNDRALQYLGTDVLHIFMRILNAVENVLPMTDFVVHKVEAEILAIMHRQLYCAGKHDEGGVYSSAPLNCIYVLQQLMKYDFAGMRRVADLMQYTINATTCNIWDLGEDMERTYLKIMKRLDASGAPSLQVQHLQNLGASSGMMQISVAFLHLCVKANTLRTADSTAHKMLLKICTGNAATTALVVEADIVRCIDKASENVHQSCAWLKIREEVIALLGSGGGAPI